MYKYSNVEHLYYSCIKLINKNSKINFNGLNENIKNDVKDVCSMAYDIYNLSSKVEIADRIEKLGLRTAIDIVTYKFFKTITKQDLTNNVGVIKMNLSIYKDLIVENYEDFFESELIERLNIDYFKNNYTSSKDEPIFYTMYNFTEEFNKLLKYNEYKYGVYFFYNKDKEIIYVGKSAKNLGTRISSSSLEYNRMNDIYYVSYTNTKSKSDVGIYEMYYISKHKPKYNTDGKEDDEMTVQLPELKFNKLIKVYEDNKPRKETMMVTEGKSYIVNNFQ